MPRTSILLSSSASCLLMLTLSAGGCNSRNAVLDTAAVTPTGPTSQVPIDVGTLTLTFTPPAVMGGAASAGTVTLSRVASATVSIGLRTGDPAVQVPPAITVAPGSKSAHFAILTQGVSDDRQVAITAAVEGVAVSSALTVWAMAPTFFSVVSEPGDRIGLGGFHRFVPENATFTASCNASEIQVFINSEAALWRAGFSVPNGTPILAGTYEGARRTFFRTANGPSIDVTGAGGGCNATIGRFVVHDVEVTARGEVRRFWATFEQYCDNSPAPLRGDIRVINPPRGNNAVGSCFVP